MNAEPQNNGAPHVSGFARIATSLINSTPVACELALLAPPARRVENGARPSSSSRETGDMRTVGEEPGMLRVGAGR